MGLVGRLGIFSTLLLVSLLCSAEQQFESRGQPPQLIELYTSEGCSSCPPADRRLGSILDHPGLWHEVVPVAFHVDYWDYLGWQDRFARPGFSERQRRLRLNGQVSAVYTPGWVVDGREWRGFFNDEPLPGALPRDGGVLRARLDGGRVEVQYQPIEADLGKLEAHVAVMGFDYLTRVGAGENRGRRLSHQFVVLDTQHALGRNRWRFELPAEAGGGRRALAVWINQPRRAVPLQVLGGWIR